MNTHADKLLLTHHILLYRSPCASLFFLSLPLLVPSIFVCLLHYFCNQAEHCLGYFYTFLTLVCLLLFVHSLPSFSHLCYKAVISAGQCALPPLSPSLSLLSCLFLSPPLLSHCLSILLLFPPPHSVTKQLTALYMAISIPQIPSLSLLCPFHSPVISHRNSLSWRNGKSSATLVNSFVF